MRCWPAALVVVFASYACTSATEGESNALPPIPASDTTPAADPGAVTTPDTSADDTASDVLSTTEAASDAVSLKDVAADAAHADVSNVDSAGPGTDAGTEPDSDTAPSTDTEPPQNDAHGSCLIASDCPADNGCLRPTCLDGACGTLPTQCDDHEPCTVDSCDDGCVNIWSTGDSEAGAGGCTAPEVVFEAGFDGAELDGVVVSPEPSNGTVTWQRDALTVWHGSGALYFGRPGPYQYDGGGVAVSASATSPAFLVPTDQATEFRFALWMDVEEGADWDTLSVTVLSEDGDTVVWAKTDDNVAMGSWSQRKVALSAFAGQTVRIRATFDSVDATYNTGYGVVLDRWQVLSWPDTTPCDADTACDDGIPCTLDSCDAGKCTYTTNPSCCQTNAECNDSDACTVDLCVESLCVNQQTATPGCCNTDSDCEDGNPCTATSCEDYKCTSTVLAEPGCCTTQEQCFDGDPCTLDQCEDAQCLLIDVCCDDDAQCDDGDDICTNDTCVDGDCVYSYTTEPGCCEPISFLETFDGTMALPGWTIDGNAPPCTWHVTGDGQSESEPWALYYGDPTFLDVTCGAGGGTATSPPILVPNKSGPQLEFDIWYEIDFIDEMSVSIISGMDVETIYVNMDFGFGSAWSHMKYDLSAYAGQSISVQFAFVSVGLPPFLDPFEGIYVDNLSITDTCGE